MAKKKPEFKTEWFSIESETMNRIKSMEGKPFYRIVIPSGVMILALTEDKKIILIKQYRPSINSYTLELPAGQIDKNESPREAALREFYEETGYKCKKFNFLGVGSPWIDRAKCKLYLFYGQGAIKKRGSEEDIKVIPVSIEEFKHLAANGSLKQLQCFATIFLAKLKFGLEI